MTNEQDEMTVAEKEANRKINKLTVEAWVEWEENFLPLVERDFGKMGEERLAFEAGWKVGFHHSLMSIMRAQLLAENN